MLEIVSTAAEFQAVKDPWNALADEMRNPLLRHEFHAACFQTYDDVYQLAVFVVRRNGAVTALAPLHLARYAGVRRLETMGRRIGEPSGFLARDGHSLRTLFNGLAKHGLPMLLSRLESGSLEAELLQEPLGGRPFGHVASAGAFARVTDSGDLTRVPLGCSFTELERRMSSGRRSDLRRYRRRAERLGTVEFEALSPTVEEASGPLREVFRIETSGWKKRSRTGILSDSYTETFYNRYGLAAARLGMLRLFFLKINGKVIAARMAIECYNRLWDLRIGYDETMRECSPGILLTHETLRYACERGLVAHEFLGRREPWEEIWPCEHRHSRTFRVYPIAPAGLVYFALEAGSLAKRKLLGTTPAMAH